MSGTTPTPAMNHLFDINNDNPKKLDTVTANMFHHNVTKLIFLGKRVRPVIQMSMVFLCIRVKEPDIDDYKKLARTMKYLRGTRSLPLALQADGTKLIRWWVNGAFAVNQDMKSHTGGMMSLGKGGAYCMLTQQKLNT
jgi:membrane carboxypeptidase/penicillin-binding protein PbpC